MDIRDFDYPRIGKVNSERVFKTILKKIKENGYVIEELGLAEIEKLIPVHFELFKAALDVAREYKKYIYNLNTNYGYDLFANPSSSAALGVINALQLAMLDEENDYINFYIHDISFGEKWKPGMVVTRDGEDYKLTSDGALWCLLLDEIRHMVWEFYK